MIPKPNKDEKIKAFPSGESLFQQGMDLRDYIATAALQGLISVYGCNGIQNTELHANNAYEIADAMLKVRGSEG